MFGDFGNEFENVEVLSLKTGEILVVGLSTDGRLICPGCREPMSPGEVVRLLEEAKDGGLLLQPVTPEELDEHRS